MSRVFPLLIFSIMCALFAALIVGGSVAAYRSVRGWNEFCDNNADCTNALHEAKPKRVLDRYCFKLAETCIWRKDDPASPRCDKFCVRGRLVKMEALK